ncbi:MAG TPA: Smr/MutS family protein [bacterium]|nr:Smr/MutS family protein [bacterium]
MSQEILKNYLKAVEFPRLMENLASHCQSPAGRDYLRILQPVTEGAVIENRLAKSRELEKFLAKNDSLTVPDSQYFIEAFERARGKGEAMAGRELAALVKFLADVVKLRQCLSPEGEIPAVFQEWLNRLQALPELRGSLLGKISEKGEVLDEASLGLKSVRDQLRALKAEVQNFYQIFLQKSETAEAIQDKIITEREGRLVVPVKRDRQSLIPGFVHGMSASGSTLFVEPQAIAESNNRVKEAVLREGEEVRKVLREATQTVLAKAGEIETTLIASAEVDAHAVLATFASRYDGQYLKPQAGLPLVLKNARHPLLALEARQQFRERVVPLEMEFEGEVKVILVSGPNAGGKTVALKTLGLACVMAQAGLPVLAGQESSIPVLKHFDSDLLDGQSLSDHLSTYAAKLRALKRMLDHCGPETLLLLDELGAGTDPREGGALGLACLETFREKGAFVLANTHQPLLKLLTQEEKGMANAAMLFDEQTGKPTYRLVSGIPGQSYAFTLAKQLGFEDALLEKAKAHLPQGEVDLSEVLAKLGQEKQLADRDRQEAARAKASARKLEEELLVARRQIKDEARRVKKEAQIEAEGLLKNTRRKVEHIIQGVQPAPGGAVNKGRINTARQEVNQKLKNITPRPVKTIVEVGELKEGDVVFFKPGNTDVSVVSADEEKEEAVILMPNGMKLSCKYSDLGRVAKTVHPVPKPSTPSTVMGGNGLDDKGKLELDIRGKLVDQALQMLDKFLDDALLVNLPFVRIIHGKGTGALKEAIHKHLPAAHPNVEFAMAEPAQGGAGVTVVKFKK